MREIERSDRNVDKCEKGASLLTRYKYLDDYGLHNHRYSSLLELEPLSTAD